MTTRGEATKDRISEQELRALFIDEFKENYKNLYYSIETPTREKYRFGKIFDEMRCGDGQSALLDMCIFKRKNGTYSRILNVEFKSQNPPREHIAKDILKLMADGGHGAFIHLLHSTDSGTFTNKNSGRNEVVGTGIFNKYHQSLSKFEGAWKDENTVINFIVISLEGIMIHREIRKQDLNNLDEIFFMKDDCKCGNIKSVKDKGWINIDLTNEDKSLAPDFSQG